MWLRARRPLRRGRCFHQFAPPHARRSGHPVPRPTTIGKRAVKYFPICVRRGDWPVQFTSDHLSRVTADWNVFIARDIRTGAASPFRPVPNQSPFACGVAVFIALARPIRGIFGFGIVVPNERPIFGALILAAMQTVHSQQKCTDRNQKSLVHEGDNCNPIRFHFTTGISAANILPALALGAILAGFYLWRRDLVANMIGNVLPKLFS